MLSDYWKNTVKYIMKILEWKLGLWYIAIYNAVVLCTANSYSCLAMLKFICSLCISWLFLSVCILPSLLLYHWFSVKAYKMILQCGFTISIWFFYGFGDWLYVEVYVVLTLVFKKTNNNQIKKQNNQKRNNLLHIIKFSVYLVSINGFFFGE